MNASSMLHRLQMRQRGRRKGSLCAPFHSTFRNTRPADTPLYVKFVRSASIHNNSQALTKNALRHTYLFTNLSHMDNDVELQEYGVDSSNTPPNHLSTCVHTFPPSLLFEAHLKQLRNTPDYYTYTTWHASVWPNAHTHTHAHAITSDMIRACADTRLTRTHTSNLTYPFFFVYQLF